MSRYGPRVLPEGRSVLADALGGLAGGFRQGVAVREHRDDRREQAIDRTRRRGREDVTWEQQDELHDFRVEDQEFDRFDRSRDIERDPMFTTDPAQAPGTPAARNPLAEAFGGGPSPGQYVPGVGFLPPMAGGGFTPPAEPGVGMQRGAQRGGLGVQEEAVAAPMAGAQEGPQTRTPEPFARVGGRDIYRNPDYVPEEERARTALITAIEELQDDDPSNDARAIASLPDNLRQRGFDHAFPEAEQPDRYTPTEDRLRQQNRRQQVEDAVDDMIAAGLPTYVIDRRLNEMGLGGVIDSTAIHGRYMAARRSQESRDLINEGRRLTNSGKEGGNRGGGPVQVGGGMFDRGGRERAAPQQSENRSADRREEATSAPQIDEDEAREARALVSHLPPEERAAALAELDFYSEADIRLILGDGG